MVLDLIASLVRAQRTKNLSNRRVALAIGVSPSAMSHYISGSSTPSLEVLLRWADFVGVQVSVVEPHLAEVSAVAALAEELTREELQTLELVARALLGSRGVPTRRAVLAASLSMAVAQVDDASAVLPLLVRA